MAEKPETLQTIPHLLAHCVPLYLLLFVFGVGFPAESVTKELVPIVVQEKWPLGK